MESDDPWNLITVIQCSESYQYINFLLGQHQDIKTKEIALFELYLKTTLTHSGHEEMILSYFDVVFHLIEDYDTSLDVPIESILEMVLNKKNLLPDSGQFKFEDSLDDYFIDDLSALCLAHLNKDRLAKIKDDILILQNPIFKMLLIIIEEEDESIFINNLEENFIKLEDYSIENQWEEVNSSNYLSYLKFDLLYASIIHDRRKIIEEILNSEDFSLVTINFPSNIKTYESSKFTTQKILQHSYGETIEFIPNSWLTVEALNNFIDSRVRKIDENFIEIDSTFLIHQFTKKHQILSEKDLTYKLVFLDDLEGLNLICTQKPDCLNHPVIATYVDLKNHKYAKIFKLNFWAFCLLFFSYLYYIFCKNSEISHKHNRYDVWNLKYFCAFSTLFYLILKSFYQFYPQDNRGKFINKSKIHFSPRKKIENILEALLIVLIIIKFIFDCFDNYKWFYRISALNIIIYVILIMKMFPYSFMFFHMELLKTTFFSFLRFSTTFAILFYSYSMIYYIVFQQNNLLDLNDKINSSLNEFNYNLTNDQENSTNILSEVKTTFENYNFYLFAILFSFFLLTYIIFNIFIGLASDDVYEMRRDIVKIVMKSQIEKLNMSNRIFTNFYLSNE